MGVPLQLQNSAVTLKTCHSEDAVFVLSFGLVCIRNVLYTHIYTRERNIAMQMHTSKPEQRIRIQKTGSSVDESNPRK